MALLPQFPVQRESLYTTTTSLLGMRTLLTLRPPPPPGPFSLYPHPASYNSSSFLSSFRPDKRFHFLAPCCSLKQTKKQRSGRAPRTAPQSIRWLFSNPKSDEEGGGGDKRGRDDEEGGLELEDDTEFKGTLLAGVLLVGLVGGFATAGYVYKDQINAFLSRFSTFIDGYGPAGYALFVAAYAGLEILAIPAIPLTMSAGLLFGSLIGTILVSISGTVSWFLFWLGMLPGTWAYVSAGALGRAIFQEESGVSLPGRNGQILTLGLGLLATALAAAYVARLTKDAVKDIE
ncbi:hypothetical protein I3760_04G009300 [Carya illinoinensis]|uniref:Uncharacterized protein n=1 Tax=Carya illinoinensis TaxID=32201 RepID=A0A922F5J5_CARIL|nr:uncharacterized protein LOC122307770 isoform X3 [Carya illinoinensis]KAG2710102.1 hypothetical protein I3760_04G009300 [Carya illinoinensis]KAG6715739.1 hypothetical protein I3842_04G009600 [Carya illinoinensis]